MYLHLGGDVLVKKDKVIAIIDLEMTKVGQVNQMFFDKMKNNYHNISYISAPERSKTLIVTITDLFFSPISSMTIYKRSFTDIQKHN